LKAYRFDTWQVGADAQIAAWPQPLRRVIFVGVDGADWDIIENLMAQDLLPNFAELVENGATGPLRSVKPLLSPLVWTTIATGKFPEDHGILNFTVVDPATGRKGGSPRFPQSRSMESW
jgi:predicted AlkP superfamily phosphohydrolase/phosphomutase